ncbi:MAG: class I SAM-dependent RNA methyltransferase [Propionibacteriaceae bacterium]
MTWATGTVIGPVTVGPPAHGGHCVARVDGKVVFVRHALPGEVVEVEVTEDTHERYARGDAVRVLEAAPGRVEPACPVARPGGCGGCDLQHADLPTQRELKRQVVAEQLRRLGGYEWAGAVEAVPPESGLGWRTRMRYQVTPEGELGLRAHRSHRVVRLPDQGCLIAHPDQPVPAGDFVPGTEVVVAGRGEQAAVIVDGQLVHGASTLLERAAGRTWRVSADGFWQVHAAAADTLARAVMEGLDPRPGETAWDLYCGVGLFAGPLVEAGVSVRGVELSRRAVREASRNVPEARFEAGKVEQVVRRWPDRADLVVCDPPRTGLGRAVVDQVVRRRPRRVAYVACDPASLGRDVGTFAASGYRVGSLRAFDIFPMTHHVECVAILET